MSDRATFWIEMLATAALIAGSGSLLPMVAPVVVSVVAVYWLTRKRKTVEKPE